MKELPNQSCIHIPPFILASINRIPPLPNLAWRTLYHSSCSYYLWLSLLLFLVLQWMESLVTMVKKLGTFTATIWALHERRCTIVFDTARSVVCSLISCFLVGFLVLQQATTLWAWNLEIFCFLSVIDWLLDYLMNKQCLPSFVLNANIL